MSQTRTLSEWLGVRAKQSWECVGDKRWYMKHDCIWTLDPRPTLSAHKVRLSWWNPESSAVRVTEVKSIHRDIICSYLFCSSQKHILKRLRGENVFCNHNAMQTDLHICCAICLCKSLHLADEHKSVFAVTTTVKRERWQCSSTHSAVATEYIQ